MPPTPQSLASTGELNKLRLANWILAGALAIALISILFGLLKNRRLEIEKKQLQFQLQRAAAIGPRDSLRYGDIVPPIEAETQEGERVTINYNGASRYLLFFLSFKCNECIRQLPYWNEIAKKAKAKNVKVWGLVTDKEGVPRNPTPRDLDMLTTVDAELLRAYGINVTPTVMLVSEYGRTQWAHSGSLTEVSTQELFGIINADTIIE